VTNGQHKPGSMSRNGPHLPSYAFFCWCCVHLGCKISFDVSCADDMTGKEAGIELCAVPFFRRAFQVYDTLDRPEGPRSGPCRAPAEKWVTPPEPGKALARGRFQPHSDDGTSRYRVAVRSLAPPCPRIACGHLQSPLDRSRAIWCVDADRLSVKKMMSDRSGL